MSSSIEEIETRLKKVLAQCTTESNVPDEIGSEGSLVGEGAVLDSVALLQFVIAVETEFSILLDDGSLTPEHFKSLGSLAILVQSSIKNQLKS